MLAVAHWLCWKIGIDIGAARAVRGFRRVLRTMEREHANAIHAARSVQVFWDDDGMLEVNARLSPEQGAVFMKALEAATDVPWREQIAEKARAAAHSLRYRQGEQRRNRPIWPQPFVPDQIPPPVFDVAYLVESNRIAALEIAPETCVPIGDDYRMGEAMAVEGVMQASGYALYANPPVLRGGATVPGTLPIRS